MGRLLAAVTGYLTLALTFTGGVLISWLVLSEPPFRPDGAGLTGSWILTLLLSAAVGSPLAGWVCRRVGEDKRSVALLIGILLGLLLVVALAEALIGPTPTGRAFLEALTGPLPADFPFVELLDGRPQLWVGVTSYVLATLGIVAGARAAERQLEAAGSPGGS